MFLRRSLAHINYIYFFFFAVGTFCWGGGGGVDPNTKEFAMLLDNSSIVSHNRNNNFLRNENICTF